MNRKNRSRKPSETQEAQQRKKAEENLLKKRRDIAYAQLAQTALGQEVLKDLYKKFPHRRPRFNGSACHIRAALIDGEQNVISWIEERIFAGRHHIAANPKNQPTTQIENASPEKITE